MTTNNIFMTEGNILFCLKHLLKLFKFCQKLFNSTSHYQVPDMGKCRPGASRKMPLIQLQVHSLKTI